MGSFMMPSIQAYVNVLSTTTDTQKNFRSRFSSNTEANVLEFLENPEDIFFLYYMHSKVSRGPRINLRYKVTPLQ